MPNDPNPSNLGAGANLAPIEDPDPVTIAPDLAQGETGADDDCDDSLSVQPLVPSPFAADVWEDLLMYKLEGDDDGPFEDGDESGPGWCDRCSPDPCDCDDEED